MIVQIRVKNKIGGIHTYQANLDIEKVRLGDRDRIDDIASDWLDKMGIDYKWYRVILD